MELQLPTCLKMGSTVRDATEKVYPSPAVLCMFLNDPADSDGDRIPVFSLNSKQLQRDVLYRKEPLPA